MDVAVRALASPSFPLHLLVYALSLSQYIIRLVVTGGTSH